MGSRNRRKSSGKKPAPRQAKPSARYSAGEIAMAILGAAILVMIAGIIITSIFD